MGSLRIDWDTPSGCSIPAERVKVLVDGLSKTGAVRPFETDATFLEASEWEAQESPEMVAAYALREDPEAYAKAMAGVAKKRPTSALAQLRLARAAVAGKGYADAVPHFELAIVMFGEYLEAWFGLGVSLERLGRHEAAVEAFKHAVQIDPSDLFTAYWLGVALVGAKDYPHAILTLEHVTETVKDDPMPWKWLGAAYLGADRVEDAQAVVERLRPTYPAAAEMLAAQIAKRKK